MMVTCGSVGCWGQLLRLAGAQVALRLQGSVDGFQIQSWHHCVARGIGLKVWRAQQLTLSTQASISTVPRQQAGDAPCHDSA